MSRLSGKESAEKKIVGKKFLSRFRLQILKIALDVEKWRFFKMHTWYLFRR